MSLIPLLLDLEEHIAETGAYGFCSDGMRCPLLRRYSHIPFTQWENSYRHGRGGHHKSYGEQKLAPVIGKEGFQIKMNVQNFAPAELSVKVIDNTIVVEARHEERADDYGSCFRHFIRKYTVPKNCEIENVMSTLSSDGILTVKAPLQCQKSATTNERVIEIQQTGPANLQPQNNDEEH